MIRADRDQMENLRVGLPLRRERSQRDTSCELGITQLSFSCVQKAGAELKGRVHSDFQALHHFLQVEEEAMMEKLKQEMEQMLTGLEQHLEALQEAIRDAEQNIHALRHTVSCADQSVLVEVIILMLSSRSICHRANIGKTNAIFTPGTRVLVSE